MSAPTTTAAREAQDFLAAVEDELADLPADERAALLEDLASHLEALVEEGDARPVVIRLGSPAAYAEELRSAAGLPARAPRPRGRGVGQRVVAFVTGPAVAEVRRLAGELRPAWWVLRGYLLVLVPCLLPNDGFRDFPVPAPLGSRVVGVVLVLAAVGASVALGRRSSPRLLRGVVAAAGVVLAVAAAVLLQGKAEVLDAAAAGAPWAPPAPVQPSEEYPLVSRSGPVTDVLPYGADGTPLTGVLLYDQDGRPLVVGRQGWWADQCARVPDQPLAADGVAVRNSFPQGYVLDPAHRNLWGWPVEPGQCTAGPARPEVPLPVLAQPTAGG